jgi:hypothetical protein
LRRSSAEDNNLANFMRTLALPEEVEHWSLTTLCEKLVKIGARIVFSPDFANGVSRLARPMGRDRGACDG